MKERERAKQRSHRHSQITQQGTGTRASTLYFARAKFSIAHYDLHERSGAGGKVSTDPCHWGSWLLGQHFSEGLLTRHDVICLDNFFVEPENIGDLLENL